jgi:hypothetical protein
LPRIKIFKRYHYAAEMLLAASVTYSVCKAMESKNNIRALKGGDCPFKILHDSPDKGS